MEGESLHRNLECLVFKAFHRVHMKSKPERIFSEFLKRQMIKYEFHKRIGPYEIDFVFGNIVVEIDGVHHDYNKDGEKNEYLALQGYIPYHFTADEVRKRSFVEIIKKLTKEK